MDPEYVTKLVKALMKAGQALRNFNEISGEHVNSVDYPDLIWLAWKRLSEAGVDN